MTELIAAPAPPAPRWPGLLASAGGEAAVRAATQGTRWEGGFRFQPRDCDLNDELPIVGSCDVMSLAPDDADSGVAVTVDGTAFFPWEAARCSTVGSTLDEVTGRVTERLGRTTSYQLEKELWTGAARRAEAAAGQYLTDGTADELSSGDPRPLAYALAELAQSWGTCSRGQRAMVHCTPKTAMLWVSAGVVFRDAGLLVDAFGNVVVAGAGYDGSGADHVPDDTGDTAWAWATPLVSVWMSETVVASRDADRVDVTHNVDTAVAFRASGVFYDPCCAVGVNVDLCSTCCVPG